MKRSGAAPRYFLAETLDAMVYWPSYDNHDSWLRPELKPDGFKYYEYILCYVDNMLCISHNMRKSMKRIQEDFKLKDDKIEPGSTKEKGTTGKFYILRGELEYVVFLP